MCVLSLPAEAMNKSTIEKRKKNYQSLILSPQIISHFAKTDSFSTPCQRQLSQQRLPLEFNSRSLRGVEEVLS